MENKDIKREIKNLKVERNITKIKNGLKLSARVAMGSLVVIVPMAIIGGISFAVHEVPFYRDYKTHYERNKTEICSDGESIVERQFEDYEDAKDIFTEYSRWQIQEDGSYKRTVNTYKIEKKSLEEVKELINKEDLKVEDVFGKAINTVDEVKNNVTQEELEKGSFYEATIYGENKENTITVRQSDKEEFNDIAVSLIAFILLTYMTGLGYLYSISTGTPISLRSKNTSNLDERIKILQKKLEENK